MTDRENLIKKLKITMPCTCLDDYKKRNMSDPDCSWCGYGEDITDFILADRKRICEPLVKHKNTAYISDLQELYMAIIAINETVALAEIGDEHG